MMMTDATPVRGTAFPGSHHDYSPNTAAHHEYVSRCVAKFVLRDSPFRFQPASEAPARVPESRPDRVLQVLRDELARLLPLRSEVPTCINLITQEIMRLQGGVGRVIHPIPMDEIPEADDEEDAFSQYEEPLSSGSPPVDFQTRESKPFVREVDGSTIEIKQKLYIPVDQYPNYNFIGRILGPKGVYLKRLESATLCKFFIRGQGSMRNRALELSKRGRPGFEHLDEKLHVVVQSVGEEQEAWDSFFKGCEAVRKMLVPVDERVDVLKRTQLRELAIMRGNYRSDKDFAYGSETHQDHPHQHVMPFGQEMQCPYPRPPPMSYDPHFSHPHDMSGYPAIRMQMQELAYMDPSSAVY
eukprot:TRINITY_DN81006_c0_g1_i1.p1 TRINITY_DN81006_c0_g1~~TRINITY_DN81006_c0_g1_i1.p1  ORF type:complete len:355 (-),score=97.92 TRINITY_DN81006_c0_g1_i1:156-1220(-)